MNAQRVSTLYGIPTQKNYECLAKLFSLISNELPNTAQQLDHDSYPPAPNPKQVDYPHRKYDITAVQVKDAYNQLVANPRVVGLAALFFASTAGWDTSQVRALSEAQLSQTKGQTVAQSANRTPTPVQRLTSNPTAD